MVFSLFAFCPSSNRRYIHTTMAKHKLYTHSPHIRKAFDWKVANGRCNRWDVHFSRTKKQHDKNPWLNWKFAIFILGISSNCQFVKPDAFQFLSALFYLLWNEPKMYIAIICTYVDFHSCYSPTASFYCHDKKCLCNNF